MPIAYNLTVSWLRKRRITYTSIDTRQDINDQSVDELLDDASRISQLREACAQLTPDEQTLLNLFYYDNRPLRDIAYILGLEPGNVATRLHRIRKKLYLIITKSERP